LRRVALVQELARQEGNRAQSGIRSAAVLASREATRAFLSPESEQIQPRLQEPVERSAALSRHQQLLGAIPGVGVWTAVRVRVLADRNEGCGAVDARHLAAAAGRCRPLPA
jgi:hypothetical protein